ncbi:SDR family oxidoreductase [Chryseolinea lacunae]|uniref:SDR family oxidoreductase n=1 Tax=Chryseolinea lacunae TaxID=2801331 RepID=A0ABS1KLY8_9BACT|nr:SDR family oxidoreductase [Chryseolinea lacunae]MBL0740360.1 SDR family oxidoreductase [Chryseolinea lacunae]
MQKQGKPKPLRKPQAQPRPGHQASMKPVPDSMPRKFRQGKLAGKVALITGGDSGIGRAVAMLFAQEGARVAIAYLNEHADARETKRQVEVHTECLLIAGDLRKETHCKKVVAETVKRFDKIDILVNNAALHYEKQKLEEISSKQLINTFSSNIFPYFWVTQAALPHMRKGSSIVNTSSVTAYRGSDALIDYASTKGAIVSFTRSLSSNLVKRGIRVNGVAPGPIWTPLIASSFKPKKIAKFGSDVPMERAGQPAEIAPSYLFLACEDSAYMTGQFLHPNGGEIVNG